MRCITTRWAAHSPRWQTKASTAHRIHRGGVWGALALDAWRFDR
jgi:hypothetical protein